MILGEGAFGSYTHHENTFKESDAIAFEVYVSESPRHVPFNESGQPVWRASFSNLTYVSSFPTATTTVHVPLTEALLSNASLYAHVFVTRAGLPADPKRDGYDRWAATSARAATG